MWFRKKKPPETYVISEEELRLIEAAEAEMPRIPDRYTPNEDNMPFSVLFPRLRNQDGTGFKPITENGTLLGRAVDDANVALEENKIRNMRKNN